MATPHRSAASPPPAGAPPRRKIGVLTCTALVVGNMIGSGIFLLPAALAPFGALSIGGWIGTSVGALLLALVFARLARLVGGAAGGPYVYVRAAFGDFAAYWIAWGYWIGLWAGNAAIAVAAVSYLGAIVPGLAGRPLAQGGLAVALTWLTVGVNWRGVASAGRFQLVMTGLKLLPLLAVGLLGLPAIRGAHFLPVNPSGQPWPHALAATMALTLWAFLGLESATVPGDDVDRPSVTIPRATVLGTVLASIVYVAGTVVVLGVVPREALARDGAPFATAATALWGSWAGMLVTLGAVASCLGTLNGYTLLMGQVPMAAARDGLFPRAFARQNGFGAPTFAIAVSAVLVTLLVAENAVGTRSAVAVFSFVVLLATLSTLLPYAFSAVALVILLASRGEPRGRIAGPIALASLAFAFSVVAVAGSGPETVLWGFVLLLLGLPVYAWQVIRGRAGRP
ncbi:amino acid permease [Anaeromyxobacter sp. Fw109-5]|uniref:amino acid permease n=1 Tax=Anaeromyxobacter sp. (strain Fw109-5) TaxID=404589 RepID=UPI0000ED6D1C|nr:amino acid permease [Anaeromyxobacter sp. Fw109-5]ABS28422.1 amino acid permease-associated region [Anaeromyxobacter sp. Fw109-5]